MEKNQEGTYAYEIGVCCNNPDCLSYTPVGYGERHSNLEDATRCLASGTPGCPQCGSGATASIDLVIFKDGRWHYHPETYDSFKKKFLEECWDLVENNQICQIQFDHGMTVVTYASLFEAAEWGRYPELLFWGNPKQVMQEANIRRFYA